MHCYLPCWAALSAHCARLPGVTESSTKPVAHPPCLCLPLVLQGTAGLLESVTSVVHSIHRSRRERHSVSAKKIRIWYLSTNHGKYIFNDLATGTPRCTFQGKSGWRLNCSDIPPTCYTPLPRTRSLNQLANQPAIRCTLQVAMSFVKYVSAAATTASMTMEALAPTISAADVATAASLLHASAKFTAVGRLRVPPPQKICWDYQTETD